MKDQKPISEIEAELTKKIIELIHGVPFDEAIMMENGFKEKDLQCFYCGEQNKKEKIVMIEGDHLNCSKCNEKTRHNYEPNPITIGRVMQALLNKINSSENKEIAYKEWNKIFIELSWEEIWKLTKKNGQECTLADQTEETKRQLHSLICVK